LFAAIELFTGLTHTFTGFLIARALFGIVRGGQWGVDVTLAIEQVPTKLRGTMSGILQEGCATGYLLAAVAFYQLFDRFSWRPLFFTGPIPAILFWAVGWLSFPNPKKRLETGCRFTDRGSRFPWGVNRNARTSYSICFSREAQVLNATCVQDETGDVLAGVACEA
jgi:MFS family permease